jgi:beta-glucosidase
MTLMAYLQHTLCKGIKGIPKILLQPGESKKVTFTITTNSLKFYNSNLKYDWQQGEFIVYIGPNSRDVKSATVNWSK